MTLLIAASVGSAAAQSVIPERRIPLQEGFDLPGGDLGPIFEINQSACIEACLTNEACTSVTYNAGSRACFPKSNPGDPIPFAGALSGDVLNADSADLYAEASRLERAEGWLREQDRTAAREQAARLGETYPGYGVSADELRYMVPSSGNEGAIRVQGALTAITDDAADWLNLSERFTATARDSENQAELRRLALSAATNAWLRDAGNGAATLANWARAAEAVDRGRDGLLALRSGPQDAPEIMALIDEFEGRYGFRIEDQQVRASGPEPRFCVTFSSRVARNADLRMFVGLPDPTLGVEPTGNELCITGMPRGQDITVRMRAGLPSAEGDRLRRDVELTSYIPDRDPTVRFPGRAYVLPASGDLGLTLYSVNANEAKLSLYRMSDRNLVRALRDEMFGTPLQGWRESQFRSELGTLVWEGFATVAPPAGGGTHPVNAEVATRLDLRGEAGPLQPGVYALTAAVPDADEEVSPAATQWFMVSDLALSSYSGTDGLTVAVRGLSDADARDGVEVSLVSRGNAVLGTAMTDEQGFAHFEAGLTRGRAAAEPALITASLQDGDTVSDFSILSLMDPEFDLSDRGVEGNPPAPPVDLFAALDRGAYRAGETAHATILARDGLAEAIEGLPLSARILRPDGAEYARLMPTPAAAGGYILDFPIPATAPRGAWQIELRVEEDGPALTSLRMLVEDFLPERIDFDLDLPDTPLPVSGQVSAEIAARWLYGAPAAELPVEGEMTLSPARSLPGWDGYVFGRHDETQPQGAGMIAGETDAEGIYDLQAELPAAMAQATRPWNLQVSLNVLEGPGRPVERRDTALILPAQVALGIRPDFEDQTVPEGSEARFSVVAIGPDLQPVAGEYDWQLNRIESDYQWYSIDGDWQWEVITNRSSVASGQVTIGADAPGTIATPVEWGEFELVLRSADGAETSTLFYAGWGAATGAQETPDRLRVTLDKPAYRHGETATVTFEAPAAGAALISVMSNRLVAMQAVETSEGVNTVELPVTDEWGAGVYVAVSAIRPVGENAGHAPMRTLGLAPASVDPGDRLLNVSLNAPEQIDPRQEAEVTLTAEGAASGQTIYATIWAVDQGILNLTGYEPPSASDHYFGQRRLGVGLRDLYGRLILASGAADGAIRTGGDAGAVGTAAPPPTEKLMAWFSGPLTLDGSGSATVSVPLPDFNGEVRLMAIAWTDSAVGQADRTMLVRDPVVMTVTAPPFLAPGDTARAHIALTHVSGPSGNVALSVEPQGDGPAIGTADLPTNVAIAEGERIPLNLSLSAPPVEGASALRVSAVLPDGRTVTKDLNIPILVNDQPVTRATRLSIAPGETLSPDLSSLGSFRPGTGRLTASVGAYALLDIPAALTLLRNYPYGCTEQLTSAAMPQLYVGNLMPDSAPPMPGDLPRGIDDAIEQILTRQTASGGFGMWNASGGEPWLDAYATDFLSRARAAGHDVPDANFRRALSNLQNRLNAATDPEYASPDEGAAMAYASYVLARERAAVVSDLRYYADTGLDGFATPMAAAQMGAALALLGDQPRADRMFAHAQGLLARNADRQGLRRDFGTLLRDRAAVLTFAAEAGSQRVDRNRLASDIARQIATRDNGRLSTQEAMWTVLAGQALTAGGDPGQGVTIGGAPLSAPVVDLGDAASPMTLPLSNTGTRPVDVTISATAVSQEPIASGGTAYSISRRYYTPEGAPLDPSLTAQGQRMVVVLEIQPFDENGGRLIITDPLPAGFEIDNPNLIESGEVSGLDWLEGGVPTEMTEFRSDRFAASVEWSGTESFQLAYRLRAVTTGQFHHPAATVSDFYRPERRGWTDSATVTIAP
ncbi:alpha-2-macroglobulin family protein [Paracoccus albus]|uniref:alpha-2-macroglobulin family protein n=1 Tax=Paracoccus albus TaxID=3017784 RepID=UPI0022F07C6A|nr:alpha-2-macroglobulin family protein [Paracoccus albus]WBU61744.1 alpha-2-macroglobulin family protein [Paracoccus albus]